MNIFHCDHCGHLLFFENVLCVKCGRRQAYVPAARQIASLPAEGDTWTPELAALDGRAQRLCRNYVEYQVCNWAVPVDDPNPLCQSCRLTRVIPDLARPENTGAWYRLEVAKRRLVFTLFTLGLCVRGKNEDPQQGLAFEFKGDPVEVDAPRVLTGHADGVITVNLAEADDAERERRRQGLGEPFRTLLGHMRHEIGHFYWDRLINGRPHLDQFRVLFGDERPDYGDALARYYQQGPAANWQDQSVTPYASAHPWEDWAETWAHYMHMVDTLETAADNGLSLKPARADEASRPRLPRGAVAGRVEFDRLIDSWFPLTYALNSLNRGLGLADAYPFVLSPAAVEKLRFVHEVIARASDAHRTRALGTAVAL